MKDYKTMFEEFKAKHRSALVMFRKNGCFIMVGEDVEVASKELGIPAQPAIGMFQKQAEFPAKALDTYLPKLVRNGHRIAILDYE